MADLRRLPNLLALRTFEAAARHQNFSLAANEIHVTHGAVSHQVRALEKELGVALFTRHGKRLTITTQGARFAQSIRNALPVNRVLGSYPPMTTDAGSCQCDTRLRYKASADWLAKTRAPLCILSPIFANRADRGIKLAKAPANLLHD